MRLLSLVLAAGLLLPAGLRAAEFAVGQNLAGEIELRDFKVELPPGNWTVYYVRNRDEGKSPRTDLGLALLSEGVIRQTAYITAARSAGGSGFKAYRNCESEFYIRQEIVDNRTGYKQECWHVRPVDLSKGEKPPASREALFKLADTEQAFLPVAMVGNRFHHANRKGLLRYAVSWNPDLILPSLAAGKIWVFQDWTAEVVKTDPRKIAVVTVVGSWGEEWAPLVKGWFDAGTP